MAVKLLKTTMSNRKFFHFMGLEVKEFFKVCRPLIKTSSATVLFNKNSVQPFGKLLVITSRHVGNACRRNRLRRLAKAIFLELGLEASNKIMTLIFKQKCKLERPELEALLLQVKNKLS